MSDQHDYAKFQRWLKSLHVIGGPRHTYQLEHWQQNLYKNWLYNKTKPYRKPRRERERTRLRREKELHQYQSDDVPAVTPPFSTSGGLGLLDSSPRPVSECGHSGAPHSFMDTKESLRIPRVLDEQQSNRATEQHETATRDSNTT